jgi:uncharacterized protein YdhG (YjbR/CyaY superfamily)
MQTKTVKLNDIDQYIAAFPKDTQILLEQLRAIIKKTVPDAEEVISYHMPAYKYHGMLVYFAAYKYHIGFYPMASGIETFRKEISGFKNAKGSVQFPLDKPLPLQLITKMITFRAKENVQKAAIKAKNKNRKGISSTS